MVSPQARGEAAALACQRGLSERRACGLLGIARSTLSYELRLPAKDAPVIEAMKTLSAQYPRYGYRRIRIFLRRQGHQLGVHRTHRLWRSAGLQLPRRRPRRRIASGRPTWMNCGDDGGLLRGSSCAGWCRFDHRKFRGWHRS